MKSVIALPATRRGSWGKDYLRLILRVHGDALNGWAFEGKLYRPGRRVAELELWPTNEYPQTPHVLEETVPTGEHARPDEIMHVLWIWERDRRGWREVARVVSVDDGQGTWVKQVATIVRKSLLEHAGGIERPKPARDVRPVAQRIVDFIDRQLTGYEWGDVSRALELVHTELARRITRTQGMYTPAAVEASGADHSPVSDPFPRPIVS